MIYSLRSSMLWVDRTSLHVETSISHGSFVKAGQAHGDDVDVDRAPPGLATGLMKDCGVLSDGVSSPNHDIDVYVLFFF